MRSMEWVALGLMVAGILWALLVFFWVMPLGRGSDELGWAWFSVVLGGFVPGGFIFSSGAFLGVIWWVSK